METTDNLKTLCQPAKIRRFQTTVDDQERKIDYLKERILECQFVDDAARLKYYESRLHAAGRLLGQLKTLPLFPDLMKPRKRRSKKHDSVAAI